MRSPNRLSRVAGLCYLLIGVFGGFAHLYVREKVYIPGDAEATARNLAAEADVFRLGFVADLLMATSFLFTGMALYLLLRHVHRTAAFAMVTFVAVGTAIAFTNMIHHFAALLVATEPAYQSAFAAGGREGLALLLLDMHYYGYLSAQVFFGLWLLPLGYLVFKSGMFPRWLGVLLIAGFVGFEIDTLALFLAPDLQDTLAVVLNPLTTVAEITMILWLLVVGARTPLPQPRTPAAPAAVA